mmetsp:Transcript_12788/g.38554  ORF Transcript_12788/g.38554 Transcript_12788/m.38554 type:complete len:1111 (-) Transcript_12788:245-3577(-)
MVGMMELESEVTSMQHYCISERYVRVSLKHLWTLALHPILIICYPLHPGYHVRCRGNAVLIDKIVYEARRLLAPYCNRVKFKVFGFDAKVSEMKRALLLETYDAKSMPLVLGVHGMGGMGKSTLADLLHDETMTSIPELRWVFLSAGDLDISEEARIGKQRSFLEQIFGMKTTSLGNSEVHLKLQEGLSMRGNTQPLMLVFDDLWTQEQQEWLFGKDTKRAVRELPLGSRVLLVSRNKDAVTLGKFTSPEFHNPQLHLMRLKDSVAEELLCKLAPNCKSLRGDYLKKAVEYCDGIPLVLTSIGNRLNERHEELLAKFPNSWQAERDHFRNLQQDPHLTMFLDVALLLGSECSKAHLTYLWTGALPQYHLKASGEDLVTYRDLANENETPTEFSHRERKTAAQRVTSMLASLVKHNLVDEDSSNLNAPRLRVCNWLTEAARDADHKTHAWWRARVHENGTGDHAQRVRDFVQERHEKLTRFMYAPTNSPGELWSQGLVCLEDFLMGTKKLEVLRLKIRCSERARDATEPCCKQAAGHLLFLQTVTLPEMLDLRGLCVLDLSHSTMEQLPDDIGNLGNLEQLVLSNCTHLKTLPTSSTFSNLTSLRHLDLSGCCTLQLSDSISALTSLEELDISGYCANKLDMPKCAALLHLRLTKCCMLEELDVSQCVSLLQLYLSECTILQLFPMSICGLPKLQQLDLTACHALQSLPESLSALKSLQRLHLSQRSAKQLAARNCEALTQFFLIGCGALEELDVSACGALQKLDLSRCGSLRTLPASLFGLENLQELNLSECDGLEVFPHQPGMQQPSPQLSNAFEQLHSGLAGLKALQILKLSDCRELREISEDISVLECLRELHLCGCRALRQLPSNISFLNLLTEVDLAGCDNLQQLDIRNSSSLQQLGMSRCSALTQLDLSGCEKLMQLDITGCDKLKGLILTACKDLTELPRDLSTLTSLSLLDLSECSGVRELTGNLGALVHLKMIDSTNCDALKDVNLSGCGSLTELRLSGCCALQHLSLSGYDNLRSLQMSRCSTLLRFPDNVRSLTSLHELNLSGCGILELPDSFSELRMHLTELNMKGCRALLTKSRTEARTLRLLNHLTLKSPGWCRRE